MSEHHSRKSSHLSLPRSPLTRAIHPDDLDLNDSIRQVHQAISSDISVSTAFRNPTPIDLITIQRKLGEIKIDQFNNNLNQNSISSKISLNSNLSDQNILEYKRDTNPTLAQVEQALGSVLNGQVLVYSSGLSAAFAALMALSPDVIAIRGGYPGSHQTIKRYCQLRGMNDRNSVEVRVIDLDDSFPTPDTGLKVLVWLETPVNPTGECRDIKSYVKKVRDCAPGSELLVDSTFAPPPLSNPFAFGADLVLHSATKYFGGHSDAIAGLLVVQKSNASRWKRLWHDRTYLGMLPGSLESWLLLRSLKTLQIRVIHQSDTSTRLAVWLNSLTERDYRSDTDPDEKRRLVLRVWHSSFQDGGRWVGFDPQTNHPRQMMGGGSPCFSFMLRRPIQAKWLPHLTKIFIPAATLGGVESLIQHQIRSDSSADPRIVRVSVGLEDFQDLRNDLIQAFDRVIKYEHHHSKL
ncbi:hypothetical protein O181_053354 [Austropuccinia psidii MF-1]|uniref:Cystathionine gamma-synthase n=1 Tax=Austropuccinia psidii MF-1 TaxID=1389203 RepID=A0A9Q3HSK4_9BASI|nr:hypothetical protein [Austropuccinia psidii MF-1]